MRTILKIFMMLFCVFSYAQTTVNGSVTDVNSQPLSGATVMVVGSSTGVVADFDGNYSITSDMDTPFTLQASSVGFQAMSIEVSSSSTVNFTLEDNTEISNTIKTELFSYNLNGKLQVLIKDLPMGERFLIDNVQLVNAYWVLIGFRSNKSKGQAFLTYHKTTKGIEFDTLVSVINSL